MARLLFCFKSQIVPKYEFLDERNGYTPTIDTHNNAILFDDLSLYVNLLLNLIYISLNSPTIYLPPGLV
jgi:hypothetical protein